jgi:hypothetical protein
MVNAAGDEPLNSVGVKDNLDVKRQPFGKRPGRQTGEHPYRSQSGGALIDCQFVSAGQNKRLNGGPCRPVYISRPVVGDPT